MASTRVLVAGGGGGPGANESTFDGCSNTFAINGGAGDAADHGGSAGGSTSYDGLTLNGGGGGLPGVSDGPAAGPGGGGAAGTYTGTDPCGSFVLSGDQGVAATGSSGANAEEFEGGGGAGYFGGGTGGVGAVEFNTITQAGTGGAGGGSSYTTGADVSAPSVDDSGNAYPGTVNGGDGQAVFTYTAPRAVTTTQLVQDGERVHVAVSSPAGKVTGTIGVYDSSSGSPVLLCQVTKTGAVASVPVTCLKPGSYLLSATFEQAAAFAGSSSGTPAQVTIGAATTTVSQSGLTQSTQVDAVRVRRSATTPHMFPKPTGTVTVTDKAGTVTTVCSDVPVQPSTDPSTTPSNDPVSASCPLPGAVPPGTYSVVAYYNGDTYYAPGQSTTATVTIRPTKAATYA